MNQLNADLIFLHNKIVFNKRELISLFSHKKRVINPGLSHLCLCPPKSLRENSHFLSMTNKTMIYFLPFFLPLSLSFTFLSVLKQTEETKKMRLVYRLLYKNALRRCCATFDVTKDYVLRSLSFLTWSKKGQISKGKAWSSHVHWWHQSRGRQTGLSSLAFHFLVSGCTD